MNIVIRPIGNIDIPALLRLVEEYWRFEDISGFDPARVALELERMLVDAALGSAWIASIGRDAVGYLLAHLNGDDSQPRPRALEVFDGEPDDVPNAA